MVNKLSSKSRTTEVEATSDSLQGAWQSAPVVSDTYLPGAMASLAGETALLSAAIKRSKTESVMDEKDLVRDDKTRALFYLVNGALYHPDPLISAAARQLEKILGKYGLTGMISESYAIESALVGSLLGDLAAPEMQGPVAAISGCAETIAALQAAQDDFEHTYVAYEEDKAREGELDSASVIKKRVLAIINNQLVVYLRAMEQHSEHTYGSLARTIGQIIDDANENVERRTKKEEPEPVAE